MDIMLGKASSDLAIGGQGRAKKRKVDYNL